MKIRNMTSSFFTLFLIKNTACTANENLYTHESLIAVGYGISIGELLLCALNFIMY